MACEDQDECVGVGYVAKCVEESRERKKKKETACSRMRVDEFLKLDLLVCSGEEENYKEKSKVETGKSKKYVCGGEKKMKKKYK